MLNMPESLENMPQYRVQRDVYIRIFFYLCGAFLVVQLLRAQSPEIEFLQLTPSFILLLIFICFILLVSFSTYLFKLPLQLDLKKDLGTKTFEKLELIMIIKFGVNLIMLLIMIVLVLIIPVGLDSLDAARDSNVENVWSFKELLELEILLMLFVLSLSQLPNLSIFSLTSEKETNILGESWQIFSFATFVLSGVITPTVDGSTQLSFAFSAISLYLIILTMGEKRTNQKFLGSLSQNF